MKKLNLSELQDDLEVIDPEQSRSVKGGNILLEEVEIIARSANYAGYIDENNFDDWYNKWFTESNFVRDDSYEANGSGGAISIADYNPGLPIAQALAYIQSLVDKEIPYRQEGGNLRTADTPAALAYMDCSELVCRYFAELGFISSGVLEMNSLAIRQYAERNPTFLQRVADENSPQAGDIFLWHRSDIDGHTGIVKSFNEATQMVTIMEAYSYGDIHEVREITYRLGSNALINHDGWEGFYRPTCN